MRTRRAAGRFAQFQRAGTDLRRICRPGACGGLEYNNLQPGAVWFYAEGVKLVTEGSPMLDLLRSLEEPGVPLLVCLSHYGLADKVKVGTVGGMPAIVVAQWAATKVVTI